MTSPNEPSSLDIEVGHRLKQLRIEHGMTQSALGKKLGITFQQIQKYERGLNAVPLKKLLVIAVIFGVNPAVFWSNRNDDSLSPRIPTGTASDRSVLALLHAYRRIRDPEIRGTVLRLVHDIAESEAPPPSG